MVENNEPPTIGFAQFGLPLLALHLLVLLINFSNLALANRVFSGQASRRITDYPNCAKPGTLPAIMTTDNKLKITFGILSIGLLITLLFKLTNVPGGMILSGLFLGGMIIVGIILGCLIFTSVFRLLFKGISFLTIFSITTTISFSLFHYQLYSPTLTIIVPNGYRGEINLVLSNVGENILTVDSNGIGYLTEWTFDKTYSRPIVKQANGMNLDEYLIGFNPSTIFAKGKTCCIGKHEIQSLSFKIGTKPHLEDEYFETKSLTEIVDRSKTIFTELGKHSITQTEATIIDTTKK